MAKKALKTQGNTVGFKLDRATGDIEFLFKLYRELNEKVDLNAEIAYVAEAKTRATVANHDQRIAAFEYDGSDGGISDEELDRMIEEAEKARPWYSKVASWLRHGDRSGMTLGFAVMAFIVGLVSLLAR